MTGYAFHVTMTMAHRLYLLIERKTEGGKNMRAKELAHAIGTDPKTFRRFMRAHGASAGKGRQYDLPNYSESEIARIGEAFSAWRLNGGGGDVSFSILDALSDDESDEIETAD